MYDKPANSFVSHCTDMESFTDNQTIGQKDVNRRRNVLRDRQRRSAGQCRKGSSAFESDQFMRVEAADVRIDGGLNEFDLAPLAGASEVNYADEQHDDRVSRRNVMARCLLWELEEEVEANSG